MLMARRSKRIIHCPKCRALGLTTDCSESLTHGPGRAMNQYDDINELIVTVTFTVPVPDDNTEFLRDRATRQRDEWIEEPGALLDVIADLGDDYDLTVRPFWEP